jgi:hypothetical protein
MPSWRGVLLKHRDDFTFYLFAGILTICKYAILQLINREIWKNLAVNEVVTRYRRPAPHARKAWRTFNYTDMKRWQKPVAYLLFCTSPCIWSSAHVRHVPPPTILLLSISCECNFLFCYFICLGYECSHLHFDIKHPRFFLVSDQVPHPYNTTIKDIIVLYEMCLWSCRNGFIASLIPVHLQLTERGHLQSTPLEQLCTYPDDAATVGNISGTLLWNSFQCCRHIFFSVSSVSWNFHPFKAEFIFCNKQKSFGVKSGEQDMYSISLINFWARNCLTESTLWAGALSWWRIQSFGQSSGLFQCFFA